MDLLFTQKSLALTQNYHSFFALNEPDVGSFAQNTLS
jgi:hypothetical protein